MLLLLLLQVTAGGGGEPFFPLSAPDKRTDGRTLVLPGQVGAGRLRRLLWARSRCPLLLPAELYARRRRRRSLSARLGCPRASGPGAAQARRTAARLLLLLHPSRKGAARRRPSKVRERGTTEGKGQAARRRRRAGERRGCVTRSAPPPRLLAGRRELGLAPLGDRRGARNGGGAECSLAR